MIRKGAAVRVLIYGSLLLIYIREIWKKAILDPFTTKGAISRHLTPRRQNWDRGPFFMGLISNIYSASCPQYHSFCTFTFISFFKKTGYLAITGLGFALVGRPFQ